MEEEREGERGKKALSGERHEGRRWWRWRERGKEREGRRDGGKEGEGGGEVGHAHRKDQGEKTHKML